MTNFSAINIAECPGKPPTIRYTTTTENRVVIMSLVTIKIGQEAIVLVDPEEAVMIMVEVVEGKKSRY